MPTLSVKSGDDTVRLRHRHANKGTAATTSSTTTTTTTTSSTTTTTITKVSRLTDTANNSNNNNNDNSSGKAKQRTMLRQLYVQRQEEQQRNQVVNEAFSDLMKSYLKSLLILCLLGTALLCFFAPAVVTKWAQSINAWFQDTILNPAPLLPPPSRTLITIYPMHIPVRRDLPGFFQVYALATPQNILARRAVQHAAGLRRAITLQNENQNQYKQTMALVPWDVLDFTTQLRSVESMNRFCSAAGSGVGAGTGSGTITYGQAFYDLSAQHQQRQQQDNDADSSSSSRSSSILFDQSDENEKRKDLMLWCLLASGHHDGYIQFHVQEIAASLSRGVSGIAISKNTRRPPPHNKDGMDENDEGHDDDGINTSIDSSSILFLPQHDSYKLSFAAQQQQPLGPSTLVPRKTLTWIVEHVHLPLHEYRNGLEEFLHQVISEEIREAAVAEKQQQQQAAARTNSPSDGSSITSHANQLNPSPPKWILWTAACSETERQSFQQQYRLMATTCITNTTTNTTTRSSDSTQTQDCCSFYDPKLPPLIRRRHDD